jgi:hypothetical protein
MNLKRMAKNWAHDLMLVTVMVAIGQMIVYFSVPFALWVGVPAFSAWGLFTGGAFYVMALSHILRRLYFTPMSMKDACTLAMRDKNTAAGLVFLGMCIVLATVVYTLSNMLRV